MRFHFAAWRRRVAAVHPVNKREIILMAAPDTIIINGRAFSWQQIVKLRRAQVEEWKKRRLSQRTCFRVGSLYEKSG